MRQPRDLLQWSSKFTRILAKTSVGGDVYASSELMDHVALLRELYASFADLSPGLVGLEVRESLFAYVDTARVITEKHPPRHSLSTQRSLGQGDLDTVYWLPGPEDPADGLTKERSDLAPSRRLLQARIDPSREHLALGGSYFPVAPYCVPSIFIAYSCPSP